MELRLLVPLVTRTLAHPPFAEEKHSDATQNYKLGYDPDRRDNSSNAYKRTEGETTFGPLYDKVQRR